MADDLRIVEAFDLIRQYAEREGWIPIGHRKWTLGEWDIEVNGTREPIGQIPPWHALVQHRRYLSMMLFHPCGGSVAGYQQTESNFCAAMRAILRRTDEREGRDG